MSSIPARLQQILAGLEGEHFEFKEWKTKDDFDGLTKYACALANEGGGKIVLGVADQRPRKIVGTQVWPQGLDQDEGKLLLHKHLIHKGAQGAPLAELAEVLPSKTIRQVQHLLRLLADEGRAIAPHRWRGWLWKSTTSESTTAPEELNTKSNGV